MMENVVSQSIRQRKKTRDRPRAQRTLTSSKGLFFLSPNTIPWCTVDNLEDSENSSSPSQLSCHLFFSWKEVFVERGFFPLFGVNNGKENVLREKEQMAKT